MAMKNIAKRNPKITFIYLHACDLTNRYDSDCTGVEIVFKMAKFYFPSVLVLSEFECVFEKGWSDVLKKILEELAIFKAEKLKIPVFIIENDTSKMVGDIPSISKSIYFPAFLQFESRVSLLK